MFSPDEIGVMVRTLGRFMGLVFEDKCLQYLKDMYGGHPLITRQACSLVHHSIGDATKRPCTVTLEYLKRTESERHQKLNTYAKYVLGVLADWYPTEYQMLQHLANGDIQSYREFEREVPEYTEHLRSYELVTDQPPRLAMTFLSGYLKPKAQDTVSQAAAINESIQQTAWDNKLLEISQLRITFEPTLRRFVKMNLMAHEGAEKWINAVLTAVPEERRKKLSGIDRDQILQNYLFLPDLLNTVLKNWSCFAHLERNAGGSRITKPQFEILMNHVNANRQDAHPKPISDQELATLRVVYGALLSTLKAYEL
jgi:hypothetical protein